MFKKRNTQTNTPPSLPMEQRDAGFLYSIVMLAMVVALFVFSASVGEVTDELAAKPSYFYFSFLATSIALIVALCCYMFLRRADAPYMRYKFTFKFDKKFYLIIALLFVGTITGLANVNNAVIWAFKQFGYKTSKIKLPDASFQSISLCVLIICILPALLEEIIFRGCILGGISGVKPLTAILICGGFFAFYHISPEKTVYQFIMGALFALITLKSGSLIPSIIWHFFNNLTVVAVSYIFGEYVLPLYITIPMTVFGLGIIALALFLLFKKPKNEDNALKAEVSKAEVYTVQKLTGDFWISAAPGILMAALLWGFGLFGV